MSLQQSSFVLLLLSVCAAYYPLHIQAVQCGLGAIDLSPLTVTSGPDYLSQPDASGYVYEMNVCAPSTTNLTSCLRENSAVCQTLNAGYVASLAAWPTNGQWSKIDNGVQLSFDNGDICFPSSNPRQTFINFVCDQNHVVGTITVTGDTSNPCKYTINFPTKYACSSTPTCGFGDIDLSPLTVSAGGKDYLSQPDATGYVYEMNVCAPSTTNLTSCSRENSAVCQTLNGGFVASVAAWPTNGQWSKIENGVQLSFDNGDNCFPSANPRAAYWNFICDPSVVVGPITVNQSASDSCTYNINFPTKYACSSSPTCGVGDIDLSPLTVAAGGKDYLSQPDATGYVYEMNVCAPSTTNLTSCSRENSAVCQTLNGNFVSVPAVWPTNGQWTKTGFGAQLTFFNGDTCFPTPNPRSVLMNFICDPNTVGNITVILLTGCEYEVNFPTKYACGSSLSMLSEVAWN